MESSYNNYKLFLELTSKTEEKRSNTGENEEEEESNKSINEGEDPKGEQGEIIL